MNPISIKKAADLGEVVHVPKEKLVVVPKDPEILWKGMTMREWASTVNFLTQFRDYVRSKSDDDTIKQIIHNILNVNLQASFRYMPKCQNLVGCMPKWQNHDDGENTIWSHGLRGKFNEIFSKEEYHIYFIIHKMTIYNKFDNYLMAIIMQQYYNDRGIKEDNWENRLIQEHVDLLESAGITQTHGKRREFYTPKQAYDFLCILKQGAIAN